MDFFGLEEQYYTHRHENVLVLVMSKETDEYKEGSDQYNVVQESLEEASDDPA